MAASQQPPTERDLELLSAYLDGELSDRERNTLERRLDQERALLHELNALRDTVALLHDLPRLKAPRNFTLDPAKYSRAIPWWKRLFTLENTLQLSGALGAVASIVLIVLALIANSGDLARETRGDLADSSESIALVPTITALPSMTVLANELDQTAIAYAGEDLLQTTMMAQSTLYAAPPAVAGTPQPEVGTAGGAVPAEGTLGQADGVETGMFDSAAQAEAIDNAVADETEAYAGQEANAPEIAAAQIAEDAPAPLAADGDSADAQTFSAAPAGEEAEQAEPPMTATWSTSASAAESAGGVSGTMTRVAPTPTALPVATGADAADPGSSQALREASEDSENADDSAVSETDLDSGTSQAVAEAPSAADQEQAVAKTGPEARDSDDTNDNALLLAIAGVIIFTLSIGLLVLGRKKAHRT